MRQRINVTLPEKTLRLIDRVAKHGDRSRLIDKAVNRYIQEMGRANLRKQLAEEAVQWADYDRRLAEEWFPLEEEAWQSLEK